MVAARLHARACRPGRAGRYALRAGRTLRHGAPRDRPRGRTVPEPARRSARLSCGRPGLEDVFSSASRSEPHQRPYGRATIRMEHRCRQWGFERCRRRSVTGHIRRRRRSPNAAPSGRSWPGVHHLSWQEAINGDPRLRVEVRCAGTDVALASAAPMTGEAARTRSLNFVVPASGCEGQWLAIAAIAGERRSAIDATFFNWALT